MKVDKIFTLILGVIVLFLGGRVMAVEKIQIFDAATKKVIEMEKVIKTEAEWKKILTPEQFHIMRQKGTESPVKGICDTLKKNGIYKCAGCATDLFAVSTKFESGTGWPSFWEPVSQLNIRTHTDNSLGIERTEVLCARCDAHLGHIFDDGPEPTGKRYCINAAALNFIPLDAPKLETAVFGAGCFWGVESAFSDVKGVIKTTVGYMGGTLKNPTYKDVSTHKTGHAEVVQIEFDPQKISYEKLLDIFWNIHDSTTPNRQGPDVGSQYRSVIFYYTPEQENLAEGSKKKLEASGKVKGKIVTEITPAQDFYKAEDYHQRYFEKQGIKPTCHIPKN